MYQSDALIGCLHRSNQNAVIRSVYGKICAHTAITAQTVPKKKCSGTGIQGALLIALLTNKAHVTHPVLRNIFGKFRNLSFVLVYCIFYPPSRNNHSCADFCCFYTISPPFGLYDFLFYGVVSKKYRNFFRKFRFFIAFETHVCYNEINLIQEVYICRQWKTSPKQ